jgi:hypothetical protein
MKKTIIVAIVMSLLLAVFPVGLALAETSQDVTVTATPSFISIANLPSSWGIGTVSEGSTNNTGIDFFTITNTSSVNISISVNCTDWSGGATPWTYGAPGVNTANLTASSGNSTGGGSTGAGNYDIDVPAGPSVLLIDAVPVSVNPNWELQLNAPTSFTHGDEQTTIVTITAAAD